jgi:hypothetical protein
MALSSTRLSAPNTRTDTMQRTARAHEHTPRRAARLVPTCDQVWPVAARGAVKGQHGQLRREGGAHVHHKVLWCARVALARQRRGASNASGQMRVAAELFAEHSVRTPCM